MQRTFIYYNVQTEYLKINRCVMWISIGNLICWSWSLRAFTLRVCRSNGGCYSSSFAIIKGCFFTHAEKHLIPLWEQSASSVRCSEWLSPEGLVLLVYNWRENVKNKTCKLIQYTENRFFLVRTWLTDRLNERTNEWMEWMDEWNEWANGWMNEWMNEWMNGRKNGGCLPD